MFQWSSALSKNQCHGGKEKPFRAQTSASLANTNKNTCIVSRALAKWIMSHTVTKRALIQMPGRQTRLSRNLSSNEDCSLRMEVWAGRIPALGMLNACPNLTEWQGYSLCSNGRPLSPSWDRPRHRKATERTIEALKKSQLGTRGFGQNQGSLPAQAECRSSLSLSKSPQDKPEALTYLCPLIRAVEGQLGMFWQRMSKQMNWT